MSPGIGIGVGLSWFFGLLLPATARLIATGGASRVIAVGGEVRVYG